MLYLPATLDNWEWQRVDRLILSDPLLYYWMHWIQKTTLEGLHSGMYLYRNHYQEQLRGLPIHEWRELYYNRGTPPRI
jgi:hypothetical protein